MVQRDFLISFHSMYERELLAVPLAVEYFQHFVVAESHFYVFRQKPIKALSCQFHQFLGREKFRSILSFCRMDTSAAITTVFPNELAKAQLHDPEHLTFYFFSYSNSKNALLLILKFITMFQNSVVYVLLYQYHSKNTFFQDHDLVQPRI